MRLRVSQLPTHSPCFYSYTSTLSPCKCNLQSSLLFQQKGSAKKLKKKEGFCFDFMNVEPTKMTHQSPAQSGERHAPQLPEEPNENQQPDEVVHVVPGSSGLETCQNDSNNEESSLEEHSSAPVVVDNVTDKEAMRAEELLEEDNGRERLKRHRIEVAGRVWIPETWGQEELLKDWVDCSAFDASLVPHGIMSARAALVEEGRRANSGGFRIENRC